MILVGNLKYVCLTLAGRIVDHSPALLPALCRSALYLKQLCHFMIFFVDDNGDGVDDGDRFYQEVAFCGVLHDAPDVDHGAHVVVVEHLRGRGLSDRAQTSGQLPTLRSFRLS